MLNDAELDLLAYDLANIIDRTGYDLDVAESDIRAALPAFIAQVTKSATATNV